MEMKVKILKNLPAALAKERALVNKYETHGILKAFETFMYLKELTTSGKLQNFENTFTGFVTMLAADCNVTRNTMATRIELMQKYELITVDRHGHITLTSWSTIAERYNVKDNQFHEIEINEKSCKLEYTLRALILAEHKNRMVYKFSQFINSNNHVREYLLKLLGVVPESIEQLSEMILKRKVHSFQTGSDSFDFFHSLPSDFNASVNKIMQYFGFKDFRQVSYWKRNLSQFGLITVQTRKYESKVTTRKANNVFGSGKVLQHFFYNVKEKIRIWQMPDAITINL